MAVNRDDAANAAAERALTNLGYNITPPIHDGLWRIHKSNPDGRPSLLVTGIAPVTFKEEFADRKKSLENAQLKFYAWNTDKQEQKYDYELQGKGKSKRSGKAMSYEALIKDLKRLRDENIDK